MALDPGHGISPISPPGSGRSSPAPRLAKKAVEDGIYQRDKVLRRYGASIERALASWEIAPQEWADFIAFLGRLLKEIQKHPKDAPLLPHSDDISYKLAQCLNPSLPSGVHQKALEVYSYIFSTFGRRYLSDHLHDFLPGLSTLLSYASLSVRPALYSIYEDFIIHLSIIELRPALKSLILSILPGLEDESSEDFERAFQILAALEKLFMPLPDDEPSDFPKDGYFWQCLFLATISNASRRQGALNYLTQRLPKFNAMSNGSVAHKTSAANGQTSIIPGSADLVLNPEPGLLIRCFVRGLLDPQLLIQRGFLDLLVANIPLDCSLLQERITAKDLDLLISAALQVLLRREMSLNRRLWSWFLGPEPKSEANDGTSSPQSMDGKQLFDAIETTQYQYFTSFGDVMLERSILNMFDSNVSRASERAKPFRICLSLMDRWEIGGTVIPRIFLKAMKSLYRYGQTASSEDVVEVMRSASLFFDGVEATFIWTDLIGLLRGSLSNNGQIDALQMFTWILQRFNVKDEEMLTVHVPHATAYVLALLDSAALESSPETVSEALDVVLRLLELSSAKTFASSRRKSSTKEISLNQESDTAKIMKAIERFYGSSDETRTTPLVGPSLMQTMLQLATNIILRCIGHESSTILNKATAIVLFLETLPIDSIELTIKSSMETILNAIERTLDAGTDLPFTFISPLVSLLIAYRTQHRQVLHTLNVDLSRLETLMVVQLWNCLSPSQPKYHVEAVKSVWQLQDTAHEEDCIESTFIALVRGNNFMKPQEMLGTSEAVRRFAIIWSHTVTAPVSSIRVTSKMTSRRGSGIPALLDSKQSERRQKALTEPLLIILDMLLHDNHQKHNSVIQAWLQGAQTLDSIFGIHFEMLLSLMDSKTQSADQANQHSSRESSDTLRQLEHVLSHFRVILQHANASVWDTLDGLIITSKPGEKPDSGTRVLGDICCRFLCNDEYANTDIRQETSLILRALLSGPHSISLRSLEIDSRLIARITELVSKERLEAKDSLMQLAAQASRLRVLDEPRPTSSQTRPESSGGARMVSNTGLQTTSSSSSLPPATGTPTDLVKCLQNGFSSRFCRPDLDKWVSFLSNVLPLFAESILGSLIPLVESLCAEIQKAHRELISISRTDSKAEFDSPDNAILSLFDALELILLRAHEAVDDDRSAEMSPKPPAASRSLLVNAAASVFQASSSSSKTGQTSGRLTVVLAFQDAVRVSLNLWTWAGSYANTEGFDKGSAATTSYYAIRIRSRSRSMLELAFSLESLESLEIVISTWRDSIDSTQIAATVDLLHVMHGMRPKSIVPSMLDSLYSRTNSAAIPAARQSCQTAEITALDIALFLSAYIESTEDDAMDEIWSDCLAFLKDVLSNPLPYRQILPAMLSLILLLAQKIENTNFGEQRKMRRDLGDLFARLLTATFVAIPSAALETQGDNSTRPRSTSLISILKQILDNIEVVLESSERVNAAINTITTNVIATSFHAKDFPNTATPDILQMLLLMARKSPTLKPWKKEFADAFNDSRLLQCSPKSMELDWFPVLRRWCLHDKERVPELLTRLTAPSSAGIMFGVGASAARLEADRKTQLNLRRLCLILLASTDDTFASFLQNIQEKIVELFEASASSSPSSTIKAELFMVCRALVLSTSAVNIAPFWPLLNHTIQSALWTLMPNNNDGVGFNNLSLLQACKLLDLLIAVSPDEFQLHEWLYISDTIDAVYHPEDWKSSALADQIAETLGVDDSGGMNSPITPTTITSSSTGNRRPLLENKNLPSRDDLKAMTRDDLARTVLQPFFSQLSLSAYECCYAMETPDYADCRRNLLEDVLDLATVVEG